MNRRDVNPVDFLGGMFTLWAFSILTGIFLYNSFTAGTALGVFILLALAMLSNVVAYLGFCVAANGSNS